jgi:hypothetical protein
VVIIVKGQAGLIFWGQGSGLNEVVPSSFLRGLPVGLSKLEMFLKLLNFLLVLVQRLPHC